MNITRTVHAPEMATPRPARKPLGLGDAVGKIATPIARVLHLPCIDPATKQLRPESGCAKRTKALNAAGRKVTDFFNPQPRP